MSILINPLRGIGIKAAQNKSSKVISSDVENVMQLLKLCPAAQPTPLIGLPDMADAFGIGNIFIKDERSRMNLGSFKALGAAYAIAKRAFKANNDQVGSAEVMARSLEGSVFVTASAGNHGLSVAAGARIFGARAVIYLAETVPVAFADKLRGYGAEVVIDGLDYEASMVAAQTACEKNGWTLLSDSTWPGYDGGRDVMEGYLAMPHEVSDQISAPPTHIFLQAGVGGLAAAVAVYARTYWGQEPYLCVVEPEAAPALMASVQAGHAVHTSGPVSNMGRLDCKEPSVIALDYLASEADAFMTLSDSYVSRAIQRLEPVDLHTSPSGGAGFAGLCKAVEEGVFGLNAQSRVLLFLSEGPLDG